MNINKKNRVLTFRRFFHGHESETVVLFFIIPGCTYFALGRRCVSIIATISGGTEMGVPLICHRPPYTFRNSSCSASDVNRFVILSDDNNNNKNKRPQVRRRVRPATVMSSIADQSLPASFTSVYCVISLTENLKKTEQRKKSKRWNLYVIYVLLHYTGVALSCDEHENALSITIYFRLEIFKDVRR